jgi:quinol monooxygenase YgiN
MSVLVIVKVQGDTDRFRKALDERPDEFEKVVERARAGGAIHHRFGAGDGVVVAVDEWESAEKFQAFFADPGMHEFIASIGGDMSTPPDITITEALETVDQF